VSRRLGVARPAGASGRLSDPAPALVNTVWRGPRSLASYRFYFAHKYILAWASDVTGPVARAAVAGPGPGLGGCGAPSCYQTFNISV